jgi:hypothetical protein
MVLNIPTDAQELDRLPPEDQARRHLTAVLPTLLPCEAYEVRCLDASVKPAATGPRLFLTSLDDVVEAAMRHRQGWDVFVGLATHSCPSAVAMADCPHDEKHSDHLSRLQTAWGDFDLHDDRETLDGLLTELLAVAVPPTVVVGSGRGVHAYWPLVEPTTEVARVERVNRLIRLRLGADNAIDAARILRVAGTFNHKYGTPLPVRLLEAPGV